MTLIPFQQWFPQLIAVVKISKDGLSLFQMVICHRLLKGQAQRQRTVFSYRVMKLV
jgi:hypothetical protein